MDNTSTATALTRTAEIVGYIFGLILAVVGLLNVMPAFGGLPRIGPFPVAQIHPGLLALGFLVSVAAAWTNAPSWKLPSSLIVLIDSLLICLAMFTLWRYFADVTTLENDGLFLFENVHAWVALSGCIVTLIYCWRIWGAPLAIVGSIALFYFFTGQFWPGIFEIPAIEFTQDVPNELWFNTGDGVLGNLFAIVITTILPFILLGAMLEGTGGGHSLIKLSFYGMRRFSWRPGSCGYHGIQPVRYDFRFRCSKRRRYRRDHNSNDYAAGFQAIFCWRCRGDSVYRWANHATHYGGGCARDGGLYRNRLPDDHYCRDYSSPCLLRLSVRDSLFLNAAGLEWRSGTTE